MVDTYSLRRRRFFEGVDMKYALVDGKKIEAFAGARGRCRGCDTDVIGKCGEIRIRHWAHKVSDDCPAAWKEETHWHRQWKDRYHQDWQESFDRDPNTGERHLADVRTEKGLVLEFQNSHIDPSERRSREAFYGNMLWVVNGGSLLYDYPRFLKELRRHDTLINGRWHYLWNRKEAFPKKWRDSSVLVFFDFLGDLPVESADEEKQPLWCLFPDIVRGYGLVAKVFRNEFTRITTERTLPFNKTPKEVLVDKEADYDKSQSGRLWRRK